MDDRSDSPAYWSVSEDSWINSATENESWSYQIVNYSHCQINQNQGRYVHMIRVRDL